MDNTIKKRYLSEYDKQEIIDYVDSKSAGPTSLSKPDWNQNDENASDYIKNRTHYTTIAKGVILEQNDLYIDEDNGYIGLNTLGYMLEADKTYYVTLNGIMYECVARPYTDDGVIIGNGEIYGDGIISNGEPFSCDSYSDGSIYLNVSTAGSYNIKIETMMEIVKPLDEKYLPETTKYQGDWNQNDENNPEFIKNRTHYVTFEGKNIVPYKEYEGYTYTYKDKEFYSVSLSFLLDTMPPNSEDGYFHFL